MGNNTGLRSGGLAAGASSPANRRCCSSISRTLHTFSSTIGQVDTGLCMAAARMALHLRVAGYNPRTLCGTALLASPVYHVHPLDPAPFANLTLPPSPRRRPLLRTLGALRPTQRRSRLRQTMYTRYPLNADFICMTFTLPSLPPPRPTRTAPPTCPVWPSCRWGRPQCCASGGRHQRVSTEQARGAGVTGGHTAAYGSLGAVQATGLPGRAVTPRQCAL